MRFAITILFILLYTALLAQKEVQIPSDIGIINPDKFENTQNSKIKRWFLNNQQPVDIDLLLVNIQPDFTEKITLFYNDTVIIVKGKKEYMHYVHELNLPPNQKVLVEMEHRKSITTPLYLVRKDHYHTATSYSNFLIWMVVGGYLFYVIIIGSFAIFSSNRLFLYYVVFELITFFLLLFQFNIFHAIDVDSNIFIRIKNVLFFVYWIIQLVLIDRLINFSGLSHYIKKFAVYPALCLIGLFMLIVAVGFSPLSNFWVLFSWIFYGFIITGMMLYVYFITKRKENLYLILGFILHFLIVIFIFDSSIERSFYIPVEFHYFESLFIPFSRWALFLLIINILVLSFLIFISFSHVIRNFSYTQSEVNKLYFKSINAIIDGEEQERRQLKSYFESNFIQQINQQQTGIRSLLSNPDDPMAQSIARDLEYLEKAVKSITDKTTLLKAEMKMEELIDILIKMFGSQCKVNVHIDENLRTKIIKGDYLMHLYRIIQEVFQNIIRHAHATEVNVKITYAKKFITYEISDNGTGYDVDKVSKSSGIGLKNIAYRAEILKGKFKIERLLMGTKFELKVPV